MRKLILAVSVISGLAIASTVVLYMQMRTAAAHIMLSRGLDRAGAFAVAARATRLDDGVLARLAEELVDDAVIHACVYTPEGTGLCRGGEDGDHERAMVLRVLAADAYVTAPEGGRGFELWYPVLASGAPAAAPDGPQLGPGPRTGGPRVLLLVLDPAMAKDLGKQTLLHAALITVLLGLLIALTVSQARQVGRERAMERERARERRFASLGQMSAVLAHEIRNPLSAIKGFAQLTSRRFPEGDPARADMDAIVGESTRLESLVKTMLLYARPREPQLVPLDLRAVVERSARLVQHDAAEAGVQVVVDVPDCPLQAAVDDEQLTQAILNLLANGVQAMAEEGGELRVSLLRGAEHARLVVEDDGPGIPDDLLPEIFEPYVTRRARGTGLGLAVARRVVEAHGGSIEVERGSGVGARFAVSLPCAENTPGGGSRATGGCA